MTAPDPLQTLLDEQPAHPVWILPGPDQVAGLAARGEEGVAYLTNLLEQRARRIELEKADPYRYGIRLDSWAIAEKAIEDRAKTNELLIMGGNRSGKSEWAALQVVKTLHEKAGAEAWCFQTTDKNSVLMQQPRVHHYLPPEWKAQKPGKICSIRYTQANGFSNNRFVAPNGSLCDFRNYAQDISTIEGGEIDIAHCDELVPLSWLQTLRYRLATRDGLLIVTFTPVQGYSPTVKTYLEGAETLESVEAELFADEIDPRRRQVPLVQQPVVPRTAKIIYFHTSANPFGGYERIKRGLAGARREDILVRAYGVPTKAIAGKFPKFSDAIHVIEPEKFAEVQRGTWYHVCDPCNGRNFSMIWALVTPDDRVIVAREWPQPGDYVPGVGDPGEWALPDGKKLDGAPGPAQQPFGFGLERYRAEIERIELELGKEWGGRARGDDGEWLPIEPATRLMDSRFGNSPTLARGESTTLIEEFETLEGGPIFFEPAAGSQLDEGISLLNDLLDFDGGQELSALNQPHLYVHTRCRNTIFALQTWTGADGRSGACKDFVDVMRYLVLDDPQFLDPSKARGFAGGVGGWSRSTDSTIF